MLQKVVFDGTGQEASSTIYTSAGKTGTAQVDADRPDDTHGWIIGYAGPKDGESTLAIAVIVESVPGQGQLTGGTDAAPIAKEVLLEALKIQGFLE